MLKQIGKRLQFFRCLKNMSREELAARLNVTQQHIGLVERGGSNPSLDLLLRAATALGTSPVNFFLYPTSDNSSPNHPENQTRRLEPQPVVAVGTWTIDFTTGRQSWSRQLRWMLGHTGRGTPGFKAFVKYLAPDDAPVFMSFWGSVQSRVIPSPLTCRIVRKDGIARTVSIQADLMQDEMDNLDMARLSIMDVTEWAEFRKHLLRDQQHLEALISERTKDLYRAVEQFRTMFLESPVSILIHDKDTGEVVDANPTACRAYGLATVEELKTCDVWLDEPPYTFADALAWIRKTAAEGPQEFEWLNRKVTGEHFWEQVRLTRITIAGVGRVMATTIDITALKQI